MHLSGRLGEELGGCNHHRARAALSVASGKQSHRKRLICRDTRLFSPETLPNTCLCCVCLAPAHLSRHSILALISHSQPTCWLLLTHPSTGWNIVSLARGCSRGEHSRHPLDTPGKHQVPAMYPVPLLSAPSPKQLSAVYPPEQDSSSLDEVFGCSCQDRRNICSEELGPQLLP